ncbi:hypothetical protein CRG98_030142 [Punica granatum]|uniref:Uncharacterized protein n=1 Tax=Punica granatum TaxID=22663 RepID=A0A2I0IZX2_PUNGR|nr:hypothetical protein CRG98_030142 [Punica granatum]
MGSNQTSDAIQLYTCALALRGDSATYYVDRAAAFTEIGEYNEAFEDCLAAIHFDPKYWNAYNRLGPVYYALGKYSEAIERSTYHCAQEIHIDNLLPPSPGGTLVSVVFNLNRATAGDNMGWPESTKVGIEAAS